MFSSVKFLRIELQNHLQQFYCLTLHSVDTVFCMEAIRSSDQARSAMTAQNVLDVAVTCLAALHMSML